MQPIRRIVSVDVHFKRQSALVMVGTAAATRRNLAARVHSSASASITAAIRGHIAPAGTAATFSVFPLAIFPGCGR